MHENVDKAIELVNSLGTNNATSSSTSGCPAPSRPSSSLILSSCL